MSKIAVIYWSLSGNTQLMAESILKAGLSLNKNIELFQVSEFSPNLVNNYDKLVWGCPACGTEELDESEFLPIFDQCLPLLKNKEISLFGSYGWGGGEWMETWQDTCLETGAILFSDSIIVEGEPDDTCLEECLKLAEKF